MDWGCDYGATFPACSFLRDLNMNRIIIGGIPAPIGGVTTYLRRLLHRDSSNVDLFLDFYPEKKEPVREDCQDKVVQLNGKLGLLRWLWRHRAMQNGREIFFNFSTPRGLLVPLLAPKAEGARWVLMLHHGKLTVHNRFGKSLVRNVLSRFDEVRSLSPAQRAFYREMGVRADRIVSGSSYCEPADHVDDPDALARLSRIKDSHARLVIMSGFPKALYNFQMGIDAVEALGRSDVALCVFIYGPGELRDVLRRRAEQLPWLYLFDGENECFFNTFLRHSDLLLRLTEVESFGISVWDADFWGKKIIASDVCIRPVSAELYRLNSAQPSKLVNTIASVLPKFGVG